MRRRRRRALLTAGAAAVGGALGFAVERRALDAGRSARPRPPQRAVAPRRSWSLATDDGARLHVEVHGRDDAPTIVLAHGWMMQRGFWAAQLADLAERWRLVVYDHRGHGRSGPPPDGDCSAAALARDLRAVLDAAVPAGARCVVAGHSMGGMALLALADADPGWLRARVAGTVLCSTGAAELYRYFALCRGNAALAALVRVGAPWLLGPAGGLRDNDAHYYGTRELALTPHADPGTVRFVQRLMLGCAPRVRAAFARTLATLDLSAAIPAVPGPVLVLVGARDRLTPPRHSALLAAGRADARLVVLPEIGHMAPLEAPEVVAAPLDAFAESVLRPVPPADECASPAIAER